MCWVVWCCIFCFMPRTAYGLRMSDWSSDVGSSDLPGRLRPAGARRPEEHCRPEPARDRDHGAAGGHGHVDGHLSERVPRPDARHGRSTSGVDRPRRYGRSGLRRRDVRKPLRPIGNRDVMTEDINAASAVPEIFMAVAAMAWRM